jgi:hypothetical protein
VRGVKRERDALFGLGGWTRTFTTDHATHAVRDGVVRPALERQYLLARVETLKRHAIELTRPLRRKLGIDQASVHGFAERVRGRFSRR